MDNMHKDINQKIFDLGFNCLLEMEGVNEEIILKHLNNWKTRKPIDINGKNGLFFNMINHAQNKRGMPKLIKKNIKEISNLEEVLCVFNPKDVLDKYGHMPINLLDDIDTHVANNIKSIENKDINSDWFRFSKSILSIANFLTKFDKIDEFYKFADNFNINDDTRIALALLLQNEIDGYGFALACDFLKENFSPEYVKPDTHIQDIFYSLHLSKKKNKDIAEDENKEILLKNENIQLFKDIIKYSKSIDKLPYEVDKLFWLIGSGDFYLCRDCDYYPQYEKNKKNSKKDEFIIRAKEILILK